MARLCSRLGVAALLVGLALIVFGPGPDPKQRYYRSWRPPGIGSLIGGVLAIAAGAWLRARERRRRIAELAGPGVIPPSDPYDGADDFQRMGPGELDDRASAAAETAPRRR